MRYKVPETGHVKQLIDKYSEEFGIDINKNSPSKYELLEICQKLDAKGGDTNSWLAMEIAVGRKLEPTELEFVMEKMIYISKQIPAEIFYLSLYDKYNPKVEESRKDRGFNLEEAMERKRMFSSL